MCIDDDSCVRSKSGMRFTASLISAALLLSACGGGGGGSSGGGGGGDSQPFFPATMYYTAVLPDGGTFTAAIAGNDVNIPVVNAGGTYKEATRSYTLRIGPRAGPTLVLETGDLLGTFLLAIVSDVTWIEGQNPTAGIIDLGMSATESVRARVDPTIPGVHVSHAVNGVDVPEDALDLDWETLGGLWADTQRPAYERVASLAYGARAFLGNRIALAIGLVADVGREEASLRRDGHVLFLGDSFPGTPPPGVDARGQAELSWIDAASDGQVGPGDNFSLVFTDFWSNDPTDDLDLLQQGSFELQNYIENSSPFFLGGEFVLTNYIEDETFETSPGVFAIQNDIVSNGSFLMNLYE